MARLIGAQRMILQAILDLPKDAAGYVTDSQIAQITQIAISDVRDWIETLEGDGYVEVARAGGGLGTLITASGRQAIRQFQPFETTPPPASQVGPTPAPSGNPAAAQPAPTSASASSNPKTQVEFFYSYAHDDESLRDELEKHLALLKRQGYCDCWHDRRIVAGKDWAGEISEHLESAKVILLLISASFISSDYCYGKEMGRALERNEAKDAVVIPVIVRDCDWYDAPFARLQSSPRDSKPVTSWTNRDEAWTEVAKGIRKAID